MQVLQLAGCLGAVLLTQAAALEIQPVEVARLPSYTEGPVADYDGNLFVSEPYGKNVTRITPQGNVSVWAATGHPNGHKIPADGTPPLCDSEHSAVLHISPNGEVLDSGTSACDGEPIRAPNDLTLDPGGRVLFHGSRSAPCRTQQPIGLICYVDAEGRTRVISDELPFPNGIVLRPDRRRPAGKSKRIKTNH